MDHSGSLKLHLQQRIQICEKERKTSKNPYNSDLKDIQMAKLKRDDQINNLAIEASMGIINIALRKQVIRTKITSKNVDEAELIKKITKKDELFKQFLLNRRQILQRESIEIYTSRTRDLLVLGDQITFNNAQTATNFHKRCDAYSLLDLTMHNGAALEDVAALLCDSFTLLKPRLEQFGQLSVDRLIFALPALISQDWIGQWTTIYSNKDISPNVTSHANQVIRFIGIAKESVRDSDVNSQTRVQMLANILGMIHREVRIFELVLKSPAQAADYVRKICEDLSYNMPVKRSGREMEEDEWYRYIAAFERRLVQRHQFYFEATVPRSCDFKLGFINAVSYSQYSDSTQCRSATNSAMTFNALGEASHDGSTVQTMDSFKSPAYVIGTRAIGFLLDRLNGSLSMSIDSRFDKPAFGFGSSGFTLEQEANQIELLKTGHIKLFVSLLAQKAEDKYSESPFIKMNFGSSEFALSSKLFPYIPLDDILKRDIPSLPPQIVLRPVDAVEAPPAFSASLRVATLKSFSNFPPTAHRKSLCASIIQRAWKRHFGKEIRRRIKLKNISAAIVIQTAFRKRLSIIMAIRNAAARLIQRNWRVRLFIHAALLRAVYKKPLSTLHRSAAIIQTEWRRHYLFTTSPFAVHYGKNLDGNQSPYLLTTVLIDAASRIAKWWRGIALKKGHMFIHRRIARAIVTIQRVFRGYSFRKMMRPEVREHLKAIGAAFAKNRRLHACYIIQKAWRRYSIVHIFRTKVLARNQAATKIQADATTHLSYGQAVFLRGICKSLRACHFIVKIYRPCGIVCPRKNIF